MPRTNIPVQKALASGLDPVWTTVFGVDDAVIPYVPGAVLIIRNGAIGSVGRAAVVVTATPVTTIQGRAITSISFTLTTGQWRALGNFPNTSIVETSTPNVEGGNVVAQAMHIDVDGPCDMAYIAPN